MADDEAEEMPERRRIGREMQARLPKSTRRGEHPLAKDADADGAADLGCFLGEFGPIGMLLGLGTSIVWILTRCHRARQRRSRP